jgi:hypothetical protein
MRDVLIILANLIMRLKNAEKHTCFAFNYSNNFQHLTCYLFAKNNIGLLLPCLVLGRFWIQIPMRRPGLMMRNYDFPQTFQENKSTVAEILPYIVPSTRFSKSLFLSFSAISY